MNQPVEYIANITESLYLPFGVPSDFKIGDLVNIRPYADSLWNSDIYRITWIGVANYNRHLHQVYVEHHIHRARKQMWYPKPSNLHKELRHA